MLSWRTNTEKALVTVQKIVAITGPIDPLDIAKIIYIAEKHHINDWGRPVYGETYFSYPSGPIPLTINNMINDSYQFYTNKDEILKVFSFKNNKIKINLDVKPRFDCYSVSDHIAIENSIMLCMLGDTSNIDGFYRDAGWSRTPMGCVMDGESMIDDNTTERDAIIDELKFHAKHTIY